MGLFTKIRTLSPTEARNMLDETKGVILLDVRTAAEYRQGKIKGAKLLPVDELSARAEAELPDKSATILVYCQSGMRAGTAAKLLTKMGYTNVFNMGGIMSWPFGIVK